MTSGEVRSPAPAGQLRAEDVSFAYVGAARAALRHVDLGGAVAPGVRRGVRGLQDRGRVMIHSLFVQTLIGYLLIFAVPMLLPFAFIKLVGLGGLRALVTYEARDSPIHRLDPRLKVLYPVGMGVLSILLSWKAMLVVFGLTVLPWFWLRPSRQKIRVLLVMIIGPGLAGFWGQGMFYLPNPPIHYLFKFPWTLEWLGSPGITTFGMIFGLEQTARVLVTVSTSMLILVSTDVSDFTWAFERFRAPPQVGFALTAARSAPASGAARCACTGRPPSTSGDTRS